MPFKAFGEHVNVYISTSRRRQMVSVVDENKRCEDQSMAE